jgi:hypothetical protein
LFACYSSPNDLDAAGINVLEHHALDELLLFPAAVRFGITNDFVSVDPSTKIAAPHILLIVQGPMMNG